MKLQPISLSAREVCQFISAKTTNSPSDFDYAVKNPRKDVICQTFVSLAIKNPIVSLSQVRVSGIKAG